MPPHHILSALGQIRHFDMLVPALGTEHNLTRRRYSLSKKEYRDKKLADAGSLPVSESGGKMPFNALNVNCLVCYNSYKVEKNRICNSVDAT